MNRRQLIVVVVALGSLLLSVSGCSRDGGNPAVSASSPGGKGAYEYGLDRLREGNYLGAAFQFEKAIREDPASIRARLQLGRAYSEAGNLDHGYFEKAQAVYDSLKTMVPEDDLNLIEGEARLKLLMWQVDDAIGMYEEALSQNPEDCELWVLLGEAIRAKGVELRELVSEEAESAKLNEAMEVYRKAIEICPDAFGAYKGISIILTQRKKYQDVVQMYVDLRKQYPDSIRVLRDYTHARFQARNWAEAAEGFARLMEKDPVPDERLMYYSVLRKLDRTEESERQLEIYMQTAPRLEGPVEFTTEDRLRAELGINELAEKAGPLMEAGKYKESRALWEEARARVQGKMDDPEYGEAARTIAIWLERRLRLIDKAEGVAKP